jgi:transposase InsO family protein
MNDMTNNIQDLIASERERWLKLRLEGGLTMVELARRSGFARSTLYLWKTAYAACGLEGLKERSRAHHSYPRTTPQEMVALIRSIRTESPMPGAERIAIRLKKRHGITMQWRTIHKVLKREGLVRTKKRLRKNPKPIPKATVPGEIVQIDVVYARKYQGKWLYQFTAIDCASRWRFAWVTAEQSNRTAIIFLKKLPAAAPFRIQAIQTDNSSIFTNYYTGYKKSADPLSPRLHVFDRMCKEKNIFHFLIDPGKPAQNGKVERSHRTDREEFWNDVCFRTIPELKRKHAVHMIRYNTEREHLALGGRTPAEYLSNCPI